MKVILWREYLKSIRDNNYSPNILCEIEPIADFPNGLSSINGKLVRCCSLKANDYITIEYVNNPIDEDEIFQSNEIKCPYCGTEVGDSWEASDEDSIVCDTCGSEFDYIREVEVSYTSTIKKKNTKITELKEKI